MHIFFGDRPSSLLARLGSMLSLLIVIMVGCGGLAYYAYSLLIRTAPAPSNLYLSVMNTPPLVSDTPGTKDQHWETYTRGQASCIMEEGILHLIMKTVQTLNTPIASFSPCFLRSTPLHSFAFQVRMTIVDGDQVLAGMFFRADKAVLDTYEFYLDVYSKYNFVTEENGELIGTPLSITIPKFKTHGAHTLTVIAQNSTFYLYLDAHYVNQVTSNLYPTGSVGLFSTRDSLARSEVVFSNIKVWKL